MTIVERMFLEMDYRNLKAVDLAKALEINTSVVSTWKKRNTNPPAEYIVRICEFLNMPIDYLLTGEQANIAVLNLSYEQRNLLDVFGRLDKRGQRIINALAFYELDALLSGIPKQPSAVISYELSKMQEHESNYKSIPLYDIPVSAGVGVFLDSDNYKMIDIPINDITIRASFCIRISGNSMEPTYENEDVIFVKQQPTVKNGELGVFVLNGDAYFKKLLQKGADTYLQSLNKEYEPIQISSTDELRVVGKVLGKYIED